MEIKVVKTYDMNQDLREQICDLFYRVFNMKKSLDEFIKQFEENEFSYSYFGLVFDEEKLVGSYAVIPYKYVYNDKLIDFAQAVDTMIDEDYRGNPFMLKKLSNAVYKELENDGINFIFGFPNDNIYLVRKRVLKWLDIYNLDIYVLPIKIGNIKSKLKPFNIFNSLFIKILNLVSTSKKSNTKENFKITKSQENSYLDYRFKNNEYKTIKINNEILAYYRIKNFDGINTAFIMDLPVFNKNNLELSVKKISTIEKNIDLIAYFGYLENVPKNLFKIPEKYKPKDTFMAGKIINKEKIDNDVLDIKNWKVNLSNFDWL